MCLSTTSLSTQNVVYGVHGEAHTGVFNPIRDKIFAGNQTAYNIAEILLPAGASIPLAIRQLTRVDDS
jgi:hypothetical protein